MKKAFILLLIFYYQTAFTQISKEEFVNEIFDQIVDTSFSKYYLFNQAEPCSFRRFDYDQLFQYSLKKMVTIDVLNELAKNTMQDTAESSWLQEKLDKATCVDEQKAESIKQPAANIFNDHSLTEKEKKKAIKQLMIEWQKKPLEEKIVFHFSQPVFTDDQQYAVINIIFDCGPECISGWTYLFKKNNNSWEIAGKIFGWQS